MGAVVLTVSVAIVALTWRQIRLDRQEVVDWFSRERTDMLDDATVHVEESLQDIADDLDFADRSLSQAESRQEQTRVLTALLGSIRAYRIAALYDEGCRRVVTVEDPRMGGEPLPPELPGDLDTTATRACQSVNGLMETSGPLTGEDARWYRIFAQESSNGGSHHVLAMGVDMRPLLDRLRSASSTASAELLVLGPLGQPFPLSSRTLARAAVTRPPTLPVMGRLVHDMHDGASGVAVVPASEAVTLGFPNADAIATYRPIRAEDASPWSAALVVSTSALRDHERLVVSRLLLAAAAAGLLLLGAASYVLRNVREQAALSERLRSAEALAHLRERAERILDHIPASVVALGEDRRASALNAALRKRAPEAGVGLPLAGVLPGADEAAIARLDALVSQARDSGKTAVALDERLTLYDQPGSYSVHAIPIRPSAPDVAVLVVIEDHSPLRALQDQLLRAEKLATVGVLAAGIAHEIGTPLGVIRGRAELAARKLGPEHAQTASLNIIVEQIDRVARIIRALLDFSRPRVVTHARVDLGERINHCIELLRYEAERRKVTLRAEPLELWIDGDPDQIEQMLVNLSLNALDATEPGRAVTLSVEARPGAALVRVQDQGVGVPLENLHRIFDPFFTTKKRGQGTGLGLPIVDQIVRDHGGQLRIDSKAGEGTTVEVTLPFQEVADA